MGSKLVCCDMWHVWWCAKQVVYFTACVSLFVFSAVTGVRLGEYVTVSIVWCIICCV